MNLIELIENYSFTYKKFGKEEADKSIVNMCIVNIVNANKDLVKSIQDCVNDKGELIDSVGGPVTIHLKDYGPEQDDDDKFWQHVEENYKKPTLE